MASFPTLPKRKGKREKKRKEKEKPKTAVIRRFR
jgi:hypothetical protein